jgi:hypothetical protein
MTGPLLIWIQGDLQSKEILTNLGSKLTRFFICQLNWPWSGRCLVLFPSCACTCMICLPWHYTIKNTTVVTPDLLKPLEHRIWSSLHSSALLFFPSSLIPVRNTSSSLTFSYSLLVRFLELKVLWLELFHLWIRSWRLNHVFWKYFKNIITLRSLLTSQK